METSIVSSTQNRSLSPIFRGLLILGAVMVLISFLLPLSKQSLALPIVLALAAMVLASVLVYFFYRSLLGQGQGSFLYVSAGFQILGSAAIAISLRLLYGYSFFRLCVGLDVLGIMLELVSLYFLCRFVLGRGPGTHSDIKATRRTSNVRT